MTDPTSPASPGARRADAGAAIDAADEMSERMLLILVDARISIMNRIPKFADAFEAPVEKSGGGEHLLSTQLVGGLVKGKTWPADVGPRLEIDLFALVTGWLRRRRLVAEAKKLGIDSKLARRFAGRFLEIWKSGETAHLARKEQTARIAELLRGA